MLAYHNDPSIKQQILEQLQGSSWNVFIEDFESRFGIPQVLARLEEQIFEGLPNEEAKTWPIRFISSIQVGADLSTVWREFVLWLLIDPVDGVIQYTQLGTEVYQAILRVAQLYQDGYTQKQIRDAAKAASYAAYDAAKAAYYAANADYAADYAALAAANAALAAANDASFAANAASFAANAASFAANAASFAAYAASYAASFATEVAYAAYDAAKAHYAAASNAALAASFAAYFAACDNKNDDIYKHARNAAYIKMSDKLIELLEKQEVKNEEIIHLVARPPKTSIG